MTQGNVKNPKPRSATQGGRVAKTTTKKSKNDADRMQKKLAAGMVNQTETALGQRAGHMELIGKSSKKKAGSRSKSQPKKQSGGSKKFG